MTWDLSDADYPQINIKEDHVIGLSLWLEKIVKLAPAYKKPWNVLVADIWPNDNMSRLIGHVQMSDVAPGYDTGYRVCAYIENSGIVGDSGDDTALIQDWLSEAAAQKKTKAALKRLAKKTPFDIRLISWGEGPIRQALKVKF